MKWRSFLLNDLNLLTDRVPNVQKICVKHGLNKAQTKAIARFEQVSKKDFNKVVQKGTIRVQGRQNNLLPDPKLNEISAREIWIFTERLEKENKIKEQKKEPLALSEEL